MVRDFSQKTVQELYETIRVNVDEEEQWKVFDFVEDFFLEELEIGDYINDINSYHLHMFDKHDVTTKKFDAIGNSIFTIDLISPGTDLSSCLSVMCRESSLPI